MSEATIAIESPDQPGVIALLRASDHYHAALYPSESNHLADVSALLAENVRFLVARTSGGVVVGCGAVLLSHQTTPASAELKRMWVDPSTRGTGLGRRLLSELEATAMSEGSTILQLETGISQLDALRLYKAAGYRVRGPFGSYAPDPLSVFMEKPVGS